MIHNKPSKEQEEIGYKISSFYLQKHNGDYTTAREEVEKVRINNIEVRDNKVFIFTSRPGLLIGRKGENIDKLISILGPIKIVESFDWNDILVPYDASEDY